jgi:hypothetical protein
MRKLGFILLLLFGSSSVGAQTPRIDRINIIAKGVYQAEVTEKIQDPSQATGQRQMLSGIKLVENTTSIPAKNPIQFGFQYMITGTPNDTKISVKMVTLYPKEGLKNPQTHETKYRDEYAIERTVGATHFKGYKIDSDWEAVPGVWTFQIWYQNRKLAEQSFTLARP